MAITIYNSLTDIQSVFVSQKQYLAVNFSKAWLKRRASHVPNALETIDSADYLLS